MRPSQKRLKFPSVGRNGFHRNIETSNRLTVKERFKETVPAQASKYLSASIHRKDFTLVEIIVALCIVAILTAIAVPGFRKATEDFRLNATL
ncbi:MAG: hypothetical protein LBE99_04455, partial [Puniceicoccales bacterium]|nr:hypothetical protein [Puniceicoccales bacterium]